MTTSEPIRAVDAHVPSCQRICACSGFYSVELNEAATLELRLTDGIDRRRFA